MMTIKDIPMPQRGICAHRGASQTHPENTLAAYQEAIRLGAHQIELDVYLTQDGHPVIIHDPTVDRTTNGSGAVTSLTLEQIKQLDAGSSMDECFAGECIPTLSEALYIMPMNIWLNIHIKGGREAGIVAAKEVVESGRLHQAFLACGSDARQGARSIYPDILICNMERQGRDSRYINDTLADGCVFIQLLGDTASPQNMQRLKAAKVRINYFETNDAARLKELFADGVDFPLVDATAEMIKTATEIGIDPLEPICRDEPLGATA